VKTENAKKPIDPKYERLGSIRKKPVSVKTTNIETGDVVEYRSLYEAMKKTGHGWRYLERRDGKVEDGIKIEIVNSEKLENRKKLQVRKNEKKSKSEKKFSILGKRIEKRFSEKMNLKNLGKKII
jgi:signal peptidase I